VPSINERISELAEKTIADYTDEYPLRDPNDPTMAISGTTLRSTRRTVLSKVVAEFAVNHAIDAAADDVLIGNSASAISFDLPPGADRGIGLPYRIKNINTGILSVTPDGSETINAVNAALDLAERDSYEFWWTGTGWETF
jgi:hypothetical protein